MAKKKLRTKRRRRAANPLDTTEAGMVLGNAERYFDWGMMYLKEGDKVRAAYWLGLAEGNATVARHLSSDRALDIANRRRRLEHIIESSHSQRRHKYEYAGNPLLLSINPDEEDA